MKTKTRVTPEGLREAARTVILEGERGESAAGRLTNLKWADKLAKVFTRHRDELLELCRTDPPDAAAELQLLRYALNETTSSESRNLIRAAMA